MPKTLYESPHSAVGKRGKISSSLCSLILNVITPLKETLISMLQFKPSRDVSGMMYVYILSERKSIVKMYL